MSPITTDPRTSKERFVLGARINKETLMMTATAEPGWGQRLAALALLVLLGGVFYLLVDQGLLARYRYYRDYLEQKQILLADGAAGHQPRADSAANH